MKKMLATMLSVLLSANANAALISFVDYGAKLYGGTSSDSNVIEYAAPSEVTLDINPLGTFDEYSYFNSEMTNEEGKLLGLRDYEHKYYDITYAPFEHVFSEPMNLLESNFQPGDSIVKSEISAEFGASYSKYAYTELGKEAPYYREDSENIGISIFGGYQHYWQKNVDDLFVGQYLLTQYSVTFYLDELTTEADFANYDDLDELYMALELSMADGGRVDISQAVTLLSFEKTNPNTSIWCRHCESLTITDDKFLEYSSRGRVVGIDYASVPEPSTNILLAMGLMGLMRIKRRIQA